MNTDKILQWFNTYHGQLTFVIQILVILMMTRITQFIARKIYDKVILRLKKTRRVWDDSLLTAAIKPIQGVILLIGLSVIAGIIEDAVGKHFIFKFIPTAQKLFIIVMVAWFAIRFVQGSEKNVYKYRSKKEGFDRTTVDAVGKLIKATICILAGLMMLQALSVNISGILAFGGISGAIIGFSAKDLLANFFGALVIFLDRPFSVGDWIRSPDRQIEGDVEHIGWRVTRIITFDKRPIFVPNAVFSNIIIENPSCMKNRRIRDIVGIRYDDHAKAKIIADEIEQMLMNHDEIDDNLTIRVTVFTFAASSIDLLVYCFTKTTNWRHYLKVKQDLLMAIKDIIFKHGAEIAFPTTTVHLQQDTLPESP